MPRRSGQPSPLAAAGAYLLITIILTWPLVLGLTRDVPSDLGDPLYVMWALAWDAEQLRAIAAGDLGRIPRFFDANIFHPAPLTLAYSEHLVAQALQILPVYLVTKNPILCYNLLFLSTFVLSGLGGFLLVRELTGNARAGFVAGVLFAFALYRWTHLAHLQVLSAQWMPFALYGVRRYFQTGRLRPLTGAAAALAAQNLSCGYYFLYFTPFASMFVLWEIASRKMWTHRSMWLHLLGAAIVVGVVTVPFLLPYKLARDTGLSRDLSEIVRYSADVYSYLTAPPINRVWREAASAYPTREGQLFPGAVPLVLSVLAAVGAALAIRHVTGAPPRAPRWLLAALAVTALGYGALTVMTVFSRRLDLDLGLFTLRATNVTRLLIIAAAASAVLCILWPTARARIAAAAQRPEAIMLTFVVLAWWLSLGPSPRVMGRPLDLWSPYRFLYEFVPGFDGVRAPARLAMIVAFGLAMLGGLAVAHLEHLRAARAGALVACFLFLVETGMPPLWVNGVSPAADLRTPEARVYRPARAPAVYHELTRTPREAVVLEVPIGDPDYDVRAVYYSTVHWRRLINGYSGFFPRHYGSAIAVISAAARGDEAAWDTLRTLGATHVIVHEAAYLDDEGARFTAWLQKHGAVHVFTDGRDTLLALPR